MNNKFLEVIKKYQGVIRKVCLIYFRDKADREDNFQEIVYQLWRSYPKSDNINNIGGWIYTISINTSISKIRKDSRLQITENIEDVIKISNNQEDFDNEENIQNLLEAIYELNPIDKSIILLYLEEKSYGEIAEMLYSIMDYYPCSKKRTAKNNRYLQSFMQ